MSVLVTIFRVAKSSVDAVYSVITALPRVVASGPGPVRSAATHETTRRTTAACAVVKARGAGTRVACAVAQPTRVASLADAHEVVAPDLTKAVSAGLRRTRIQNRGQRRYWLRLRRANSGVALAQTAAWSNSVAHVARWTAALVECARANDACGYGTAASIIDVASTNVITADTVTNVSWRAGTAEAGAGSVVAVYAGILGTTTIVEETLVDIGAGVAIS